MRHVDGWMQAEQSEGELTVEQLPPPLEARLRMVVRPPLGARERAWRHLPAGAPSDGRELAARVQVVVPAQRCRASEAPLDAVCPAAFGSRDAARQSPGVITG